MDLDTIKKQLKNIFSDIEEIMSAYVYGSILSDRFDNQKSDILFICKDSENPHLLLKKIKKKREKIKAKLDISVVFYSEFLKRWHIYRPPTYFIGIKLANEFLWGDNLIQDVSLDDVKPIDIYKRIVDLSQGIRGVYINGKNDDFWCQKYKGWLKVSLLEILYLHGNFNLNFNTGLTVLLDKYPELKSAELLLKNNLSSEELSDIAELLRVHMFNYFIKK